MSYELMSTIELQTAGLKYAQRLREFQDEVSQADTLAMLRKQFERVPGEGDEQESARLNRYQSEDMQRRGDNVRKVRADFRTDGTLLYEELLKRTGERKVILGPLEYGMLAGPAPLEEVAHEIERLSKNCSLRPD